MSDVTGNEIAIVGMAGRFPGAADVEAFWSNLRNGVEAIRALDDAGLRAAGVPDAVIADPSYVKAAAVLDGVGEWDAEFFGFSPNDAAIMDPQHRLFLECGWEALENAGHPPDRFAGAIAVFAGCGQQQYYHQHVLSHPRMVNTIGHFLLRHTGNDKDFLATRFSYLFDLRGPSINVQTACSTSLVAVHLAVQSLLAGESDMAVAGGVTIELPQGTGYHFREGEILSPDGHCRAFDAESKGTIFGSGAGVVVLRRLSDAIADGDHVWAVIRGSAVNNDGAGKVGYLAPSVDGQGAAASEAIAIAGVDASTIGFLEAHGTGTPVGDPIEVAALTQAFRGTTDGKTFCALGSVKTNIGHLDTAAGVAGLIKATLAVHHGEIPPTLNFTAPNPLLDLPSTPFYVNTTTTPWPNLGAPRRAGVNSVAVGGTNAHVIIEQAPAQSRDATAREAQLLVVSARTRQAVDDTAERIADDLSERSEVNSADVAYTLQVGRREMRERRAVVLQRGERIADALMLDDKKRVIVGTAPADAPSVAFCFAGGGAQYVGMGADLYASEPVYRDIVDRCLSILQSRGLAPDSLPRMLRGGASASGENLAELLEKPTIGLPALIITQIAVAELWKSWGIRPSAMIGHSMGEYTAAYLAGVFSLDDVLRLAVRRGQLFEQVPAGGMVSVPLSADDVRPWLGAELSIAAENAPGLCVVSGPVQSLDAFEKLCAQKEIETTRLHIAVAAHSAMLEPILAEFGAFFGSVAMRAPNLPFVSNLTGDWITAADATSADYWVRHLRQTVRFDAGARRLLEDSNRVLVEVGPGRTLVTLAKQQPTFGNRVGVASMRRHDDPTSDVEHILDTLGRLWAAGVAVDWTAHHAGHGTRRRVPLPTYAFQRQKHWIEPAAPVAHAADSAAAQTSATGPLETWFHKPSWVPAPLSSANGEAPGRVVLVYDDETIAAALNDELTERGWRVTRAHAGGAAATIDGDRVAFDAASDAGWESLVAGVLGGADRARALIDVRNLRVEDAHDEDRSFYQSLRFARALASADLSSPLRVVTVASGTQRVGDDPVTPAHALSLGASRVMSREIQNVSSAFVDVAYPSKAWQRARVARQLADEAAAADAEPLVCYRGGDRLVRRFEQQNIAAAPVTLKPGATWLITGGLGGIGLAAAELLARSARAKLILVGRKTLPPRAEWESWLGGVGASDAMAPVVRQLLELERLGAEVMTPAADLSDRASLDAALTAARARFGPIHGVIHAAGVLADAPILAKSDADAAAVLAPKVAGTLALDAALAGDPIEHFLICSSISAVAGLAGQVDYAAASAFLDSFAAQRRERDGARVTSIGWSAWSQVGMSAAFVDTGAAPAGRSSPHPVLGTIAAGKNGVELHDATTSPASHWLLDEHRLRDGAPLIPGTGYLELARAALDTDGSGRAVELRDVMFLSPFLVPDGTQRELRLALRRRDGQFVVAGRKNADDTWTEHAVGFATPFTGDSPTRIDVGSIERRLAAGGTRVAGAEDHPHLTFGARWDNVRGIVYAEREALLSLELPTRFADDLRGAMLHPALLDMATAGAQRLVPGYDATRDFYVPASYGRLVAYAPLTPRVTSHVRWRPTDFDTRELASFDVTVCDEQGNVLVEVEEFLLRGIDPAMRFDATDTRRARGGASTLPLEVDARANGGGIPDPISPEEGVEVLRRILASDLGAHVIVARRPVVDAVEALARIGVAPERDAPKPAKPLVRFPETEAKLATHPAVGGAIVLERFDRPGNRHVVAYILARDGEHPTVSELRRYVKKDVPQTSVPGTILFVDAFPMSGANVDLAALHDPFGLADDHIAPRTETEKAIAAIWRDALGLERVGVRDNFFDLGGHSLLAVRAIVRLEKAIGARLNQAIMVLQTLEQIAAEIDRTAGQSAPAAAAAADAVAPEPPATAPEETTSRRLFQSIRNVVGGKNR